MEKVKTIPKKKKKKTVFWRFSLCFFSLAPVVPRSRVRSGVEPDSDAEWWSASTASPKHDIKHLWPMAIFNIHQGSTKPRGGGTACLSCKPDPSWFSELKKRFSSHVIPIGKNSPNWEPKTVLNGVPPRRWPGDGLGGYCHVTFYHLFSAVRIAPFLGSAVVNHVGWPSSLHDLNFWRDISQSRMRI